MPDLAQETIDYIAVNRLQHAYADIATRRAWAELDEIFIPDIPISIDLRDREPYLFDDRDAFREFVSAAVDRFEFFEFVLLNTRVYLEHQGNPDAAVARMYMSELRQDHAERRWSAVAYVGQHSRANVRGGTLILNDGRRQRWPSFELRSLYQIVNRATRRYPQPVVRGAGE